MTPFARVLTALYVASAVWLAYCTVQTWGRAALWASILTAASGLATIVAGLRESSHADDVREIRVQLERALRPAVMFEPRPAAERPVMTAAEEQVFEEIKANYKHGRNA
ncbi:hypothetical protein [Streptomyces sp. NPDC006333]|uniref:hypothetical protein n=1 Tax=Streptomyces sp. NPDC006333 TaxID=3156753 RepID=UPI0033AD05A1